MQTKILSDKITNISLAGLDFTLLPWPFLFQRQVHYVRKNEKNFVSTTQLCDALGTGNISRRNAFLLHSLILQDAKERESASTRRERRK